MMRYIQKTILLVVFSFSLFSLTGCNGRYTMPGWEFGAETVKQPAQAGPNDLMGPSAPAKTEGTDGASITVEGVEAESLSAADNKQSIEVGILLPLSGPQKNLGDAMLKAAQMALFDVGNMSFKLVPYDTKGSAEGATIAAQNVIKNDTKLVLGPVFSASVRAAKDVLRNYDVNMIAYSTDWSLTSSRVFTMGFLPFDQIERVVSYSVKNNIKRIGVIAPQTTYGRAVVAAYQAIAEQYGVETVDILVYSTDTNNLAPDVRKFAQYDERIAAAEKMARDFQKQQIAQHIDVKDGDLEKDIQRFKAEMEPPFDAVLIAAGSESAIAISNLLSHFDLPPRLVKRLGTGLFDDNALSGEFALRDAWFAAPSINARQAFEKRYLDVYGEEPPRLASLAYDSTALAAVLARRGMESGNEPDFNRIAITNPNGFSGVDGIFRFLDNGTVERGLAVLTFQDGGIYELDPAPATFQKAY